MSSDAATRLRVALLTGTTILSLVLVGVLWEQGEAFGVVLALSIATILSSVAIGEIRYAREVASE